MKAYCKLTRPNPGNDNLCFTYNHLFLALSKYIPCTLTLDSKCTHMIFMDFGPSEADLEEARSLRKAGMKVCIISFDPPNFNQIDEFKRFSAVDKIILFDSKFKNDFPEAYISDFFFYEDLFPTENTKKDLKLCTFGHLSYERHLPDGIDKVDENISSYHELYSKVSNYSGVYVFDTGLDRNRANIVHYNKAKAVEALMCGVNSYCTSGINTIKYQHYIKPASECLTPTLPTFDQSEIFKLNRQTLTELVDNLK